MRILITQARFGVGGTETYSMTVAEHLEQLGHGVTLHAAEARAEGRELASSRGLRLVVGEAPELDEADAAITQDTAGAYLLADRRAGMPLVSVTHGLERFEQPAQLTPAPPAVVLNDRVARHAAALSWQPRVVRLRQPIDIKRFRPRAPIAPRARRVLLFSNYLGEPRLRILQEVCDELGLELVRRGLAGETTVSPQEAIAGADIVVGYGRSLLEGMAMGRAAYVWDYAGGDGWVTPDNYEALEADGFSGAATDDVVDADRLRADFAAYRQELGPFNFDLVRKHHSAARHAEALVDVLELAEAPVGGAGLEALSLLARAEARASDRATSLEAENRRIWEELEVLRLRTEGADEAAGEEQRRRLAAEAELGKVLGSRSWRLAERLRRPLARLRGR